MDGENNGKPYEQMEDLGGFTTPIFGNLHMQLAPSVAKFAPTKSKVTATDSSVLAKPNCIT